MAMKVRRYKMVNMARTPEEVAEDSMPAVPSDGPKYPWGLCLTLNERDLEKLGLDADCEIGDTIHLFAMAEVTSVNKSQSALGEECCNVSLQITHLEVEDEDQENEEAEEGEE